VDTYATTIAVAADSILSANVLHLRKRNEGGSVRKIAWISKSIKYMHEKRERS